MTLETKALSVGYGAREVLGGIDAVLREGRLACLVGPNGVGKSTLLRTLAGLQPRCGGTILLDGDELAGLSRAEVAKRISVVLTDRVDPGRLTVNELVGIGRHPHTNWLGRSSPQDQRIVAAALAEVGAEQLAEHPITELSDGQRQRVMIARALAQEPRVLLLDEPTAFLDPPGKLTVFELLRRLAADRGLAVLVCTHDVELAVRHAEEVWAVAPAGLVAGAPEDLMATGALAEPFRNPGVGFDVESLTFRREEASTRGVSVVGEGEPAWLAQHCLRRAGYTIKPEASDVELCVEAEPGLWRIADRVFTSLGALYEHMAGPLRCPHADHSQHSQR